MSRVIRRIDDHVAHRSAQFRGVVQLAVFHPAMRGGEIKKFHDTRRVNRCIATEAPVLRRSVTQIHQCDGELVGPEFVRRKLLQRRGRGLIDNALQSDVVNAKRILTGGGKPRESECRSTNNCHKVLHSTFSKKRMTESPCFMNFRSCHRFGSVSVSRRAWPSTNNPLAATTHGRFSSSSRRCANDSERRPTFFSP